MHRRRSTAVAAIVAVVACSSATQHSGTTPVGGHNVLTAAELQASQDRTLFETVQRLRPAFFRSRQVRTTTTPVPEPVHVYVNGSRAEGLDALKLFPPRSVTEVRFYEPNEANVRFGPGHYGGLIAVTVP
jgi:hypothetical protein